MTDPNSPKQVQRQAAEMKRYDEEMERLAKGAAPPSEETEETPQADESTDDTPDPAEATPPPAPQPTGLEEELAKYKQRYNSLMGKYNAEVPRLTSELKDLKAQMAELIEAAKNPKTPAQEAPKIGDVTEADVDAFGADLIDLIKRQSAATSREMAAAYEAEIKSLKAENKKLNDKLGTVEQTQQYSSQQQVLAKLGELVPDWEQINQNEDFLEWLGEHDPMSGQPRQEYLNSALAALDPKRLAHVFDTFKQAAGLAQPQKKAAKTEVQRQVAPGRSKATPSAPSAASADTRIWTSRDIEQFYSAVRAGEYQGREAEARSIEQQIDSAIIQGRYRG